MLGKTQDVCKGRNEGCFLTELRNSLGRSFCNLYQVLGGPHVRGGAVGGAQAWCPWQVALSPPGTPGRQCCAPLCPAFGASVVSLAPWWPVIFQQLRASLITDLRAICMAWWRPGFWSGEQSQALGIKLPLILRQLYETTNSFAPSFVLIQTKENHGSLSPGS